MRMYQYYFGKPDSDTHWWIGGSGSALVDWWIRIRIGGKVDADPQVVEWWIQMRIKAEIQELLRLKMEP
jgi:hypothetical protein